MREHGLIEPLVVREAEHGYELVDGERRYRACTQAAVTEVPVIIRETDADTAGLDVGRPVDVERRRLVGAEQHQPLTVGR